MLVILNAGGLRMVRGGWLYMPEHAMSIVANTAPSGSNLTYNVNEGVEINYNLLAGFTDANGDPLKISLVGITHAGTGVSVPVDYANNPWSLTADGNFYYTANMLNLAAGVTTTDIFQFRVWDGLAWSPLQVTVNVNGVGTAPAAPADYAVTAAGQTVVLPVLDNDGSLFGGGLFSPPVIDQINGVAISAGGSVAIMNGFQQIGTATLSGANGVQFTPVAGYSGTANFSYHVSYSYYPPSATEPTNGDYTQTATVTVVPQPNAGVTEPTGYDDAYNLVGGSMVRIGAGGGVLANDYAGGPPMFAQLVNGPTNGTLDFNADGSFSFTPNIGAAVTSTQFSYQVKNAYKQDADIINVTLNFGGTAVAANDHFTINEDSPLTITAASLFGNDSTPSGSFTGIRIDALPFTGSLTLNGVAVGAGTEISVADLNANKLVYVPPPNGSGQDVFSYSAIVNGVTYTDYANVSILINSVNDAPTTSNNTQYLVLNEGDVISNFNLRALASDADDSQLRAQLVSVTSSGYNAGIPTNQSSNVFDFNADDLFSYDSRFLNIPTGQSHTETFEYKLWDGQAYTTSYLVVTVNGNSSGSPVVTGQNDFIMTPQGQPVSLNVFANDARAVNYNFGSEHITSLTNSTGGGVFSMGTQGNLIFTPNAGFTGLASVDYQIAYSTFLGDGLEGTETTSGTAIVRVLPTSINLVPDGVADTYTGLAGAYITSASDGVLANDSHPGSEALGARLTSGPSEGTLDFNTDGSFTYVASAGMLASAPGTHFTVNFSYRAFNGTTEDNNDTLVTFDLTRPYTTPVVADDNIDGIEGQALAITPEALFGADGAGPVNDSQAEGQAFSAIVITSLPADGVLSLNGTPVAMGASITGAQLAANQLQFVPDPEFSGDTSFMYQVSSAGSGISAPATVNLHIAGTNDAPVFMPSPEPPNVFLDEAVNASAQTFQVVPAGTMTFSDTDSTSFSTYITLSQAQLFLPGQAGGITPDQATMTALTAAFGNALSVANAAFTPSGSGGTLTNTLQFQSLAANLDFLPETGALRLEYSVVVSDGQASSNPIPRLVIINGTNDGPQAVDDLNASIEGMPLFVDAAGGVLYNDTDPDTTDTLTVTGVSFGATAGSLNMPLHGANGTLFMHADGSYEYNPNFVSFPGFQAMGAGEYLQDIFTYAVSDGHGGSDTATLTVRIEGMNQAPMVESEFVALMAGETVERNAATGVLANDDDVDTNDTLSVSAVSVGPVYDPESVTEVNGLTTLIGSYGALAITADGAWSYSADDAARLAESATDFDIFQYVARDNHGAETPGVIQILVTGVNDAPDAVDDSYGIVQDMPLIVPTAAGLLDNDSDPDGDSLHIVGAGKGGTGVAVGVGSPGVLQGTYGNLTLNSNGSFSYLQNTQAAIALAQNEPGYEVFTYQVADSHGLVSIATLTIEVGGQNDGPHAFSDEAYVNAGGVVGGMNVLANDTDPDGDMLRVATVASTGAPQGVPEAGVTIVDGQWGRLLIEDSGFWTYEADTGAAIGLGGGDVEEDVFTYTVADSHGATDIATLAILVTGQNDAPQALADGYMIMQGALLSVPAATGLLDNDSDPDGDSLRISGVGTDGIDNPVVVGTPRVVQGTYGTLSLNSDGSFSYLQNTQAAIALAQNETGHEIFTYEIADSQGLFATSMLTIDIEGINDAPDAANDAATVNAGGVVGSIAVLANDQDPDGDTLRVAAVAFTGAPQAVPETGIAIIEGQWGRLLIDDSGSATYEANAAAGTGLDDGETAEDVFTYTLADSHGATDLALLTITINGLNDAPLAQADSYTATQGQPLTVTAAAGVLANDSDPDVEPLSAVLGAGPAHGSLTLNADGSFSYTAANGYTGTDSFSYRASDGNASSALTQVNINVQPQPVVLGNKLFINEIAVNAGAATVTINTNNGALPDKVVTAGARIELFNFSSSAVSAANLANVNLEVANGSGRLSVLDLGNLTGLTSSATGAALAGTAIQANGSLVLYEPNATGLGIWQTYSSSGVLLLSGTYQDSGWQLGSSVAAPVAVNLAEGAVSIDFFAANGASLTGLVDPQGAQTALTGVTTASAPHALGAVNPFSLPDLSSSWFGGAQLGADLTLPADVAAQLLQNAQFNASLAAPTDTVFARSYDHYLAATGGTDDVFADQNDAGDWTYGRATLLTLGKENTVMSGSSVAVVANALDATDNINPMQGRGAAAHGNLIAGITNEDGQTIAVYSGFGQGGAGHDFLYGIATNDSLQGNGGNDYLYGDGGKDTLTGGSGGDWLLGGGGSDRLIGGSGADRLTGGSTADVFAYLQTSDSLASASDIITDFAHGTDAIDLSAIDARDTNKFAGNQAFGWAGNTASTVAYSVSWSTSGSNTIVRMDNTGDTTADMVITLNGIVTLTSGDFVL